MLKSLRLPTMLACVLSTLILPSPAPASPKILVDLDTSAVLYAEDADASWFPASVTKLMTAKLAFDAMKNGKTSPDTPIVMSAEAASVAPSKLGIAPGTALRLEDALQITLTRSMNDLASSIGENLAGSRHGFVGMMNAEAARLGMKGTRFANPSGLPDSRQVSTAQDLAILAARIVKDHPNRMWLFSIPQVRFARKAYKNTNGLIGVYSGALGMKTGYVCGSGFNLVAVAQREGRRLLAVVLGAPDARRREKAATALLDYGFSGAREIGRLSSAAERPGPATDLTSYSCGRSWRGFSTSLVVPDETTPAVTSRPERIRAQPATPDTAVRKVRRF